MFAQSVLGSSSHMRLQFALLYGFLLLFIAKPINTLSCYHPDGTRVDPSKKMIACNSTAEFTHCCADGDQCLTNGLCKAAADGRINSYWRESCTDPTWKSPACPHYCHDASIDPFAATGDWLTYACSASTYCCKYAAANYTLENHYECCSDPTMLFDAGPARRLAGATVITSAFPTTMTGISVSITVSITPSKTANGTVSSTAAVTSVSSQSTTVTATAQPELSLAAKIGIGLGVPLVVICFLGAGGIVWFHRRKRQREKMQAAEKSGNTECQDEMHVEADHYQPISGLHELPAVPEPVEIHSRPVS